MLLLMDLQDKVLGRRMTWRWQEELRKSCLERHQDHATQRGTKAQRLWRWRGA